jgi:protocatechuate 3,4-dioxygenase beta subunit
MSEPSRGPSRRTLIIAGAGVAAAGVGALAVSRAGFAIDNASRAAASHSFEDSTLCVVTASFTEGPFYVDDTAVRSDVREDRKGLPTTLKLKVVDANGCVPMPGAAVDVWHCDAAGNYSASAGGAARFLRGRQIADADGFVTFQTIYPGWYPGRAPHIHLKVLIGKREAVTTQLFFAEKLSDAIYAAAPYVARGQAGTTNAQDGVLGWARNANGAWPKMTRRNDGLLGTLTLGVTRA